MIEVPNFGSLRGSEREIVILRSDNGETWREHTVEVTDAVVKDILGANFDKEGMYNLKGIKNANIHITFCHYLIYLYILYIL